MAKSKAVKGPWGRTTTAAMGLSKSSSDVALLMKAAQGASSVEEVKRNVERRKAERQQDSRRTPSKSSLKRQRSQVTRAKVAKDERNRNLNSREISRVAKLEQKKDDVVRKYAREIERQYLSQGVAPATARKEGERVARSYRPTLIADAGINRQIKQIRDKANERQRDRELTALL